MRIDPESGDVTDTVGVKSRPSALAIVDGAVWTAALAAPSTHRGGTLRVAFSDCPRDLQLRAFGFGLGLPRTGSLMYDGLISYRRAGGSAGTALVGDLATDVPQPSPDGLTYRFRLRPNLRFSDGAPVTPEDVRASVARRLAFGDPGWFDVPNTIKGAERCTDPRLSARARFRRCDLSDGVETDAAARTVTFHLIEAGRRLPAQARAPAGPAGREPGQAAAHPDGAGHGPLHRRALGPAERAAGPQPALPRVDARPARRLPRSDQLPLPADQGPDRRRREGRGGHRPLRRPDRLRRPGPGAARRTAACRPGSRDRVRVPQRPHAAVRRRPRPAGTQLRRRPRPARRAPRRGRDAPADLPDAAAGLPGLHAVVSLHRQPELRGHLDGPGPGEGAPARRRLRDARHEGRVLGLGPGRGLRALHAQGPESDRLPRHPAELPRSSA